MDFHIRLQSLILPGLWRAFGWPLDDLQVDAMNSVNILAALGNLTKISRLDIMNVTVNCTSVHFWPLNVLSDIPCTLDHLEYQGLILNTLMIFTFSPFLGHLVPKLARQNNRPILRPQASVLIPPRRI